MSYLIEHILILDCSSNDLIYKHVSIVVEAMISHA
jgi:hypothetical protein